MPVVFCADANYGIYLPVVLQSIIDNSHINYHYKIFILDIGISKDIIEAIKDKLNNKENFSLEIYEITEWVNKYKAAFKIKNHWSMATYGRFLIPDICAEYEKVIYADVDVIFDRDIAGLMAADLGENYIAGVPEIIDECRRLLEPEVKKYYYKTLKLKDEQLSVNAGLLVFNVPQWRLLNLSEKGIRLLAENDFHLLDQDAINRLCRGNIYYLDFHWNCVSWAYHYIKKKYFLIKKDATSEIIVMVDSYLQSREEPKKVFHYNEPSKPWNNVEMWGASVWWYYAARTSFCIYYLRNLSKKLSGAAGASASDAGHNKNIKKYCLFGLRIAKVITGKRNKKYYLFGIKYFTIKTQKH